MLLATAATIIASQAVISGAFSLTRQAALLGAFPRIEIMQTSRMEIGQIYIPLVNWVLMIATIGLVVAFRKSHNLASAYGVAVTTTMVITTLLAYVMAREKWEWNRTLAILISAAFLAIDLAFFGANIVKVEQGGWFPLVIGALVFLIMSTWQKGREIPGQRLGENEKSLEDFLQEIEQDQPMRVPGTAIFMTGRQQGAPPMLMHHLQHNKALHEQVLLLTVAIEDVPYVWASERVEIKKMDQGFVRVIMNFGFMEDPDVPDILYHASQNDLDIDLADVTYFIGRQTIVPTEKRLAMALWREKLFAFMVRNAAQSTTFFRLPPEDVVELGIRIQI